MDGSDPASAGDNVSSDQQELYTEERVVSATSNPTGSEEGNPLPESSHPEEAQDAQQAPPPAARTRPPRGDPLAKVYVKAPNVGETIQVEDLKEAFSRFGKIIDVWVAKKPSGFAFVQFELPQDANEAIARMDNTELGGQVLAVQLSNPRRNDRNNDRNDHRGGGGNLPGGSNEVKAGDWACPQCNLNNFARRDRCFKCGAHKPQGGGGGRGPSSDRGRGYGGRGRSRSPDRRGGRDYGRRDYGGGGDRGGERRYNDDRRYDDRRGGGGGGGRSRSR